MYWICILVIISLIFYNESNLETLLLFCFILFWWVMLYFVWNCPVKCSLDMLYTLISHTIKTLCPILCRLPLCQQNSSDTSRHEAWRKDIWRGALVSDARALAGDPLHALCCKVGPPWSRLACMSHGCLIGSCEALRVLMLVTHRHRYQFQQFVLRLLFSGNRSYRLAFASHKNKGALGAYDRE